MSLLYKTSAVGFSKLIEFFDQLCKAGLQFFAFHVLAVPGNDRLRPEILRYVIMMKISN